MLPFQLSALPTKVERLGLSLKTNLRSRRRKSKRSRRLKPQLDVCAPIRPPLRRPVPAIRQDLRGPLADSSGKWRRIAARRVWWVEVEDHPGTAIAPFTIAPARTTTASRHS